MYCRNCGEKMAEDSNFCEKCGTKFEKTEDKDKSAEIELKNNIDNKSELDKEVKNINENIKTDIDVSDLKPDDLDELMPKKNYALVICVIIVILMIGVGGFIYYDLTKSSDNKKTKAIDYQAIIDEYAKSIETVASEYLIDHEIINDFSEIEDLVKYNKHKVSCDNIFINIDGTVYLSECSVDGKKVDEVYGRRKSILTKDSEDACYTKFNSDSDELEFYVDGEITSIYTCEHDKCDLYQTEDFKYNSCLDLIAVIEDGETKYLYNYKEGQKILDGFDEIVAIKDNNKYVGFIVKDNETSKYGYIDTRGIVKIPMEYDVLGLISADKMYDRGFNYTEDKIIAKKDNKYGVIKLSTGDEIVPFNYDEIYLGVNDYYVIREDKSYYLINKDGKKVLDKAYKMIFAFDNLLIVNEDNKLKFIDYNGNSVITDELETYIDYKEEPVNGVFGYNATQQGNEITIVVNKASEDGYNDIIYVYNIDSKKLEEK